MKKLLLSLAACATLGMSMNASADDHTVTLGYAESKMPVNYLGDITLKGATLKYRYEWDNPVSIITSLTYLGGNLSFDGQRKNGNRVSTYDKYRNWSIAAGPAYRFNEFISIYGLAGINLFKHNSGYKESDNNKLIEDSNIKYRTTSFLYGAGVQINPMPNFTLDVGYEGTRNSSGDGSTLKLNGFNIGVGYRF